MSKIAKTYFCVYCGRDLRDSNWSKEHIIPQKMGGPKSFAIIACYQCNNSMSREFEQAAMNMKDIRLAIGHMGEHGFVIKRRGKKDYIKQHRALDFLVACLSS